MNSETNSGSTGSTSRGPQRPFWLALPLLAVLGGSVWWMNSQDPQTPPQNAATPLVDATPVAGATQPAATTQQPETSAPQKLQMVLFLPDENAQLKRKVLPAPFPALPASEFSDARKRSTWQEKLATSTVQKLLQTAPRDFPAGARLSSPVVLKGDVLDLNFNSAFAQSQFWQGSARTRSSVYSLVNSVSNTAGQSGLAPTKPKVRFLIDGKPIEVLGELSMDEPLEADMKLVAGA